MSVPTEPVRAFKVSAGGNDFIVLDEREQGSGLTADEVRHACARRLSVGADGVICLRRSARATAGFELWNRDGSRAALSGNGARAAVRVLVALGADTDGAVTLDTASGVLGGRQVRGTNPPEVEMELGGPVDVRPRLTLPESAPAPTGDYAVVGVPYLAVPVPAVDALDLDAVAPPLRRWSALPEGANVAFYEPAGDGPVRLRTWERGVEGETLSSGTGCAMVAVSLGLRAAAEPAERVSVLLAPRSGSPVTVTVRWKGREPLAAMLRGEARLVAEVALTREGLEGFDPGLAPAP